METVNEINLSISEFQDVNELNAEELEAVAGGDIGEWWEDTCRNINEGFRDMMQGLNDGLDGQPASEQNNNYLFGRAGGGVIRSL
jgi:hypothetical protein